MRCVVRILCSFVLAIGLLSGFNGAAHANSKYAAYVVHAHSGDVLFDRYSTQRRYPASLTKMMTLYLLFDEIEAGRLSLDSKLKVSAQAAAQPPSKLGVRKGSTIDVETAIEALVVKSANDVAVVVAEAISGSEWRFARKMTQKARALGMRRTTFRNASGLPNSKQVTTARDMARLAQSLMGNHPEYWHYFSTKQFAYKGRTYRTHNALVRSFPGADGLKTGYTRRSGYNLATSVKRDGHHLIGIVLGGRSGRTRDAHMRKILTQSFAGIRQKPTLIASLHRTKPAPRLKPTLSGPQRIAKAAPTVSGSDPLKQQILAAAATLGPSSENEEDLFSPSLAPDKAQTILDTANQAKTVDRGFADDTISALIATMDPDSIGASEIEALSAKANDSSGATDDSRGEEFNAFERERLAALGISEDGLIGQGDVEPALAWSIQIGAYSTKTMAQNELETAALVGELPSRERSVQPMLGPNGQTIYRARFTAMSESEATEICAMLRKRDLSCFTVHDFTPAAPEGS